MPTPKYEVTVSLIGKDGNAFGLIGEVARVLRREVSREAADEFAKKAMESESYDALLAYIQDTVHVI